MRTIIAFAVSLIALIGFSGVALADCESDGGRCRTTCEEGEVVLPTAGCGTEKKCCFKDSPASGKVPRDEWVAQFEVAMMSMMCREDWYFRTCFSDLSADTCASRAQEALKSCLDELKDQIPEQLSQPEDGRHWGNVVGGCAGQKLELMSTPVSDVPECKDVNHWF